MLRRALSSPGLRKVVAGFVLATAFANSFRAAPPASVEVLHATVWSPGDSARSGAGEFEVLLQIARLRREHVAAGIVSVGDHNGMRPCGGELALRRAALSGLLVAKIARRGSVARDPDGMFLDGGSLDSAQAARVITSCLELFGPPPAAADPERPTAGELAAIRAHLRRCQAALVRASEPLASSY